MAKYADIEDFMAAQPSDMKALIRYVRQLMSVAHPQMRERFMYDTVFFVCYDYVCYLGKIHPQKGIEIAFPKGKLLDDEGGLLEPTNRKFVKGVTFKNLADFQAIEDAFLVLLQEAILLNEANPNETFFKIVAASNRKKKS
jgi:hypothetical protein